MGGSFAWAEGNRPHLHSFKKCIMIYIMPRAVHLEERAPARRSGWAGAPPGDEAEARERLMDAAIRCARRDGLAKTTVSGIAAEAGVTRVTVYAYFPSRDEIVEAAMARAGAALAERLAATLRQIPQPADQVVEATVVALREIPRDPSLALMVEPAGAALPGRRRLRERGLALIRRGLEPVVERHPPLAREFDEAAEVVLRFLISLMTLDVRAPRNDTELRAFLHRRLVPALGLPPRRGRLPSRRR